MLYASIKVSEKSTTEINSWDKRATALLNSSHLLYGVIFCNFTFIHSLTWILIHHFILGL